MTDNELDMHAQKQVLAHLFALHLIDPEYSKEVVARVYYNPGDCTWGWWTEDYVSWFGHPTFKEAAYMFVHWLHDLEGNVPPKDILEVTLPILEKQRA